MAALNGLGLAVIHRLDLAYDDSRLKPHGFAAPAADLDDARRGPVRRHAGAAARPPGAASASPTPAGWPRSCCCCCRWSPASARPSTAPGSGSSVGPFSFQPGEVAKVLLVIAFAGYLVLHRDALALAGRRVLVRRPAARPRPRPDPGDVADQPRHPGLPARPRLQPAVLRPVPGHALRRHRAARLAGRRRRAVPAAAPASPTSSSGTSQNRVDIWLDPFDATSTQTRRQLPARRGACSAWRWGGLIGRGFGGGSPERIPLRRVRLHHRRHRRGARADRRDRGDPALRPDRRARPARRADLPRRLRQADGDRSRRGLRPPGLRRHRRRHPADPAHRPHHAVPVLRRLLAGRQLGDHRAAAAHLRPGPPAGARPLDADDDADADDRGHPGGEAAR